MHPRNSRGQVLDEVLPLGQALFEGLLVCLCHGVCWPHGEWWHGGRRGEKGGGLSWFEQQQKAVCPRDPHCGEHSSRLLCTMPGWAAPPAKFICAPLEDPLGRKLFLNICLFLAVLGLHCCCQAFFSSEQRLLSSWSAWASHCSGLSYCRAQALGHASFSSWGYGLQSAAKEVTHGLSYPAACGIFQNQGWNLCPCIARQILNQWTTRDTPLVEN